MKPFRFRPQRVLNWREQLVEGARLELARALAAAQQAERELQAAIRRRHAWEEQMAAQRLSGQTAKDWERDWWITEALRVAERVAVDTRQQARAVVAHRRRQLETARRQARSLGRLRERRQTEHRRRVTAVEQHELDEWTAARGGRAGAWPGGD